MKNEIKIKKKKNLNLSYNLSKKRSLKKNNNYNKTMIIPNHLLPNVTSKEFELKNDDISVLSNANLNIIKKILTTYANENIINRSTYLNFNNDNQKDKFPESKKYYSSIKENHIYNFKNSNLRKKSNKSNYIYQEIKILERAIKNFHGNQSIITIQNLQI